MGAPGLETEKSSKTYVSRRQMKNRGAAGNLGKGKQNLMLVEV